MSIGAFRLAQRTLPALLLGGVATLGFAPFHLWLLSPVALAALFFLCRDAPPKRAALLGWLFGLAHFATGIYWVVISTYGYGGAPLWLGLLLALALFSYMAIYPMLACALTSRLRLWHSTLVLVALPAFWVLGELVRGWFYSGFPWLSLGYVALDTPAQSFVPLVGVHGLSALFALSAAAIFRAVDAAGARPRVIAAGFALTPLLGLALPAPVTWTADAGEKLSVAIVQGNVPQDRKWQAGMSAEILTRYHQMTLQALADSKLVVWPEVVPNQPLDMVTAYFDTLDAEAKAHQSNLIAGVLIRDEKAGIYNSMIALGRSRGRYDKHHLVPFGEYFPIPGWLRPMMDVLNLPYSDFSSGSESAEPIVVEGQRVGMSICFEDVFASEHARETRGAALLVNATNDAWFARSSAPYQHLDIARYRALENGRWLVRATNTGFSAIIAPDGTIAARTGLFETRILRGSIVPRSGLTPYTRTGDRLLWIVASVLVVLLIALGLRASSLLQPAAR